MNTSFVLCARTGSSRVPSKILRYVNGEPFIGHLVKRLADTGLSVIVAAPKSDQKNLEFLQKYGVKFYFGDADNPLARTVNAAKHYDVQNIVRVTHDKLFIEPSMVFSAIAQFQSNGADYLYSSDFPSGCAFEIFTFNAVNKAFGKFKKCEHISYAIKAVTNKIEYFTVPMEFRNYKARLLFDYEDDLPVFELLLSQLGNDCSLRQVLKYLKAHKWATQLNALPKITYYTCAYNAEKWLDEAIGSVVEQEDFENCEYILIDDHSTDRTPESMLLWKTMFPNIHFYRNPRNIGLASSSNIALKVAKGQYIIRLDADDYFTNDRPFKSMISHMRKNKLDVLYPAYYFGTEDDVRTGEAHHAGGALFNTSAINHVKFTEGLRGHDSLDLWHRSKDKLNIGYWSEPTFMYRQHPDSLSKQNPKERELIKQEILSKYGGSDVLQG